ncbi:hypothetical protein CUMW_161890 [Citrus unshiu]|uniref:Uncharacterized protein n=2 Tax=Citrus TaxID=2706 RepID=A0A2H5PRV9_CITUN|nr:hypothetical protein CUMW_161890 [Citrus unshiu]
MTCRIAFSIVQLLISSRNLSVNLLAVKCRQFFFFFFNCKSKSKNHSVDSCSVSVMFGVGQRLFLVQRRLHTLSRDGPSESLKKRVAELEKTRKRKNVKKNDVFVEVPESKSFLDTASLPMFLTVAAIALFAKLLMMYDDSKSQEMIEHKIKNAPPGQGTMRMLTHEEWEEFQEVRPRTPFESKLARPNAKLRTGEPLRMGDLKDWTIDVLTDALTRAEECARHNS